MNQMRAAAKLSPRIGNCAVAVNVARDTLSKRLKDTPEVKGAFDQGADDGLARDNALIQRQPLDAGGLPEHGQH